MQRSSTWLTKELPDYLLSCYSKPFVWGTLDCCLFAAGAALTMTGVDIAEEFRGKYTDEASAFALIKTVTGGSTVADAFAWCATKYGMTEWVKSDGSPQPLMAKRGDIVACLNGEQLIAGIIDLSGRYVAAMAETGFIRLPLSSIQRAWHVPAN
ncbi:DUF6950 family protein [Granulicella cerasi]|uniref:DUF6950 family protein n=1 Tax=Granulicella cerasi TaxID=741063 RepID=A0ABW1Z426_9BACT|nr:hypothetical protein [Granulicella cerasi]